MVGHEYKMAEVALNLTKEAVSLEGEGFGRTRKLQIFINCQKQIGIVKSLYTGT